MSEVELIVVRRPVRGSLVRHQDETVTPDVTLFSMEDLRAGRIAYEHQTTDDDDDLSRGSGEATRDKFSVVARLSTTGKHSAPRTVHVAVAARNIQPPYLTNHRPLRVNIGNYWLAVPH